jgi:hypothetical protein
MHQAHTLFIDIVFLLSIGDVQTNYKESISEKNRQLCCPAPVKQRSYPVLKLTKTRQMKLPGFNFGGTAAKQSLNLSLFSFAKLRDHVLQPHRHAAFP